MLCRCNNGAGINPFTGTDHYNNTSCDCHVYRITYPNACEIAASHPHASSRADSDRNGNSNSNSHCSSRIINCNNPNC